MDEETLFLFGLCHLPSFGQARLRTLLSLFGSSNNVWHATRQDLLQRRVPEKLIDALLHERNRIDLAACCARCKTEDIRFIPADAGEFPPLLREIPDAPLGLFIRGSITPAPMTLAVVGTRRPSLYGVQVTKELSGALAQTGVSIVSGLALGIDAVGHKAALEHDGTTIAVLAAGLDRIYPRFHSGLAEQIVAAGGALLSEFPPGTPALRHHFPIRNRIIAGMSHGTVVTEAPEKSGALLTAMLALEYNREIFAVPGPITSPLSYGTHSLIRQGAQLVRTAADIVTNDLFHTVPARTPSHAGLTATEQTVLGALHAEPQSVDQLQEFCTLETSVINATLTLLHMKGYVEQIDPLHFVRRR